MIEITEHVARKVLEVVDCGLRSGAGPADKNKRGVPGNMCVEAAVCYALDLPHGDDPECVSRALRSLKIRLNDSRWSSNEARAKGLRRLAVAQLGSRDVLDDKEFVRRVVDLAIRKQVPIALRAAASIIKDEKHKAALSEAANRCEKDGTREAALNAHKVGRAAADAADAADAAAYAAYAADAAAAAAYAAYAAAAAADAAAAAAYAAYAAAAADAAAAAAAAAYAAYAAAAADAADAYASRDKVLGEFAEDVVAILIDMKAPGCQWLALTEAA